MYLALLILSVLGLILSLVYISSRSFNIKTKAAKTVKIRPTSEILNGMAQRRLKEVSPEAEKLHAALSDILIRHDITRVRTGFLSYDLLYYIKPGKWFGFTSPTHPSDDFTVITVGKLYHFDDCIPRMVIAGDYSSYLKKLNELGITDVKIPKEKRSAVKSWQKIIIETFPAVIENIGLEVEDDKEQRLRSYLIKELKTTDDLKTLDPHAVIDKKDTHQFSL